MRVFGSRYFAYDENTLRAADALGVEYVLGRGTAGALATIYAPREYKTKIISVSNMPFGDMGTGSLCDYSLWARGSTDKDFAAMVNKVLASQQSDLILVSHAYIGGTYAGWWQTYENALARPEVKWRPFGEWVRAVKINAMPLVEIPTNREVKYDTPRPGGPARKAATPAGLVFGPQQRRLSGNVLCVPKILSVLIGGGNYLNVSTHDRAAVFCPYRLGLAIQVEEPA